MLDVRRFDEASELLTRVVSAEPESSRAWCLMARAHLGADRYAEAVTAANRAVALDPADDGPHRLASNALVHLGHHPDALRAAHPACRLPPRYSHAPRALLRADPDLGAGSHPCGPAALRDRPRRAGGRPRRVLRLDGAAAAA